LFYSQGEDREMRDAAVTLYSLEVDAPPETAAHPPSFPHAEDILSLKQLSLVKKYRAWKQQRKQKVS